MLSMFMLIVALLLSVSAESIVIDNSPITLPISRRVNTTSMRNLLKYDLLRAQAFRSRMASREFDVDAIVNEPVNNQALFYTASVGVGNPPATYELLIDTGSSNTWVGATKPYIRTITSAQTPNRVSLSYGTSFFSGIEFTDTVTLAPGLVISNQSIGVASTSSGFGGIDGVLGIGPIGLTVGTLSPATNTPISTITDNLFAQGIITANQVSISFQPTKTLETTVGELTWGGTDSAKFIGVINFTPTLNGPVPDPWIYTQTIRYGSSSSILSTSSGILDTGTTLLFLASDAFARYRMATGAIQDSGTGLLRITASQFAALQSLFFTINGVTYEFTANAQIWPRALNFAIGGSASSIYLIIGDLGSPSGGNFSFLTGFTFLQRFYTVLDTTGHRIGFANTAATHATTN